MTYMNLFFLLDPKCDAFDIGFDLVAIFSEKMVESSMEMAELENASPHEAERWFLHPNM